MNKLTRFFASIFGGFFDQRLWNRVGGMSRSTTARIDVSEDSALNYAAVWCATRLLCGTGAGLPLNVFESENGGDTRVKLPDHPIYRLMNIAPNPEQDAISFRSVMWQWQVNWGNAFAEIVREVMDPEAPVVELWPLHPSRVTPKRYEDGSLYYQVHEFGGAPPKDLQPWQMFHMPSIITYDGLIGRGVIQHARETIGAGIGAEKRAANTFGAGHVPAVVIEYEGKAWNDEARENFRKEWKEIYGHPDGDEVALLQGGGKAKALGFSAQDSQFIEGRMFDIEEIARWYGVSPHLLQHLLRATFNNIEELGIDFVRYGLRPWLKVWNQVTRRKLIPEDEWGTVFVEHDVGDLEFGNAESRAKFYSAMTASATMTRNECRRREHLDPVDGGDVFLVQGAMVPLDEDGKPESAFVNGTAGPPSTDPAPAGKSEPAGEAIELRLPPERIVTNITYCEPTTMATVAANVHRIITRDLSRMLTKESKQMESCAKKPNEFIDKVEEFYVSHRILLLDVVNDSVTALNSCGYQIDTGAIASTWVNEGKSLMLEAAGTATPKELADAVKRVIESKTWSERPLRAIERAENATLVV